MSDTRLESLQSWLEQYFNAAINIKLISGDASFRRYFRITHVNDTFIAVDSPIDLEPITPFVELTASYQNQNLCVPEVICTEEGLGFKLLSDLGDHQLGSVLSSNNIKDHYTSALELLPKIAKVIGTDKHALPNFGDAFITMELNLFIEWFLERHLNIKLSATEQELLKHVFDFLTHALQEQPQCTMHRDYHSRNIMVKDEQLHLIDYQDSVVGPFTYDAVSLLRDCYVVCPDEHFTELQQQHFELFKQEGLISEQINFAQYQRWFDLTGLQRHIKIAGIFCRLYYRDGKAGYLKDLPQTLDYILQVSGKYPELADFDYWLRTKTRLAFEALVVDETK